MWGTEKKNNQIVSFISGYWMPEYRLTVNKKKWKYEYTYF